MAYMGNLQKGDRVRVSFEAEVAFGSSFGVDLQIEDGPLFRVTEKSYPNIEFEKVEPPVEVFKPGDVVRNNASRCTYTVGRDGFVDHLTGRWVSVSIKFTSDKYEKVDL